MTPDEARHVLQTIFGGFPSTKVTDELREVWYEVALEPTDYLNGMRIGKALAAACEYAPVPKQFIEMRNAANLPERHTRALPGSEWEGPSANGRVWLRHINVMMQTVGAKGQKVDLDGHEQITGDSWASCPACREYARELAASHGDASGSEPF